MNIETEKKRKVSHILSTVTNNQNLSKIDIRKHTAYSMSTINSALDTLAADNLININKIKCGTVLKTIINYNPRKIIAGVSFYRMKLYGTLMTFQGEILHYAEKDIGKDKDIFDAITALLEGLLSDANLNLAAIGVSIAMKDTTSLENVLALRFGVSVYIMDNLGALAMHQRYIVSKNNHHIVALYIGKQIRCVKVKDSCEYIELGNLLSPIISAQRGRLLYDEVLSTDTVKSKITAKYGILENMYESAIFEPEAFSYTKQIKYALGELLLLLDKTLKPCSILVAGDYINDGLIEGSLDTLGDNVRAKVVCLDNGYKKIIEGAGCIALNALLYY